MASFLQALNSTQFVGKFIFGSFHIESTQIFYFDSHPHQIWGNLVQSLIFILKTSISSSSLWLSTVPEMQVLVFPIYSFLSVSELLGRNKENFNQCRLRQAKIKTEKKFSQAKILTKKFKFLCIFCFHAWWILKFF